MHNKVWFSVIISFYFMSFLIISCKQTPANSTIPSHIYYLPQTNVYYDEAAGLYFYSLDSGKNWVSYANKNADVLPASKIDIKVTEKDEVVWKQNEIHLVSYNGTRLSILSADTGISVKQKTEIEKKAAIIANEKGNSEANIPQTKKPNLFKRLFGKKKKRN